jgi:cytochrome c553
MSRFGPRRILTAVGAVAALLVVAGIGAVYGVSEWRLRRHYDAPLNPLLASKTVDLAEGERMARIVGCWDGCHGRTGQGGHVEMADVVRQTAPTLSQVLPQYDDEELVRLIRYGLKRDGHSALGMSSFTFWTLGEQDLANIIAHLRRQPAVPPIERKLELHWRGRVALATGMWKVSAEEVDRTRPRWGDMPRNTPLELGRYLASITCSECHGLDYTGNELERAPSLAVIGAYSAEQFTHLMRTAQPVGGRTLDKNMQWVANAPFTDAEIAGLYQFLRAHHGLAP